MDLTKYKAILGDDYAALEAHINDLTGQRDTARNESINQRKTLKTKVAELEAFQSRVFEKMGIDSADEFDSLPNKANFADAEKQLQTKLKRLESDLQAKTTALTEIEGKYKGERLNAALLSAISKHNFLDNDVALALLRNGADIDGDSAVYKNQNGTVIPLVEAAANIAAAKPFLVKSSGQGGAGTPPTSGTQGGQKSMTQAQYADLSPAQKLEFAMSGGVLN